MPKTNVNAVQRVPEYPKDHLVAEKGKLLCSEFIKFRKKKNHSAKLHANFQTYITEILLY